MLRTSLSVVGCAAFLAPQALAVSVTGPSSSQSPYLVATSPSVSKVVSIMTVGDSVNLKPDGLTPYRAVGIMDGLGAYDNGDGTFTLLMNHEIGSVFPDPTPASIEPSEVFGTTRAHGNNGAFVSRWTIEKSTLRVIEVQDFLPNSTSVFLSNNNPSAGAIHTAYLDADTTTFLRLCSADLAAPSAYRWTDTNTGVTYGTDALIFQSGEESSGVITSPLNGPEARIDIGRQFAFVATDDSSIVGDQARTAYELPHAGLFSWENNLASPFAQRKTIVAGMDDSTGGQVYFWVGDKQQTGNVVERAGLTYQSANDGLFVVKVDGLAPDGTGATNESRGSPLTGSFSLEREGDVSGLTFGQLESLSDTKGGTQFLRPEDGQWDPNSPNDYYFVTTDRYDQVKDGVGAQVGRSRLYRLRFTDIANPELGGSIEALLDGSEAGNMFDNMTIGADGNIYIQEDVGGQQHSSKLWRYSIAGDSLTEILQHDPARFGGLGLAATAPFNQDEESSGIIDVSHILGKGWFLATVQAHYSLGGELVEGGQLLAINVIPEPAAPALGLMALAGLTLRRRRA